ncbi:MAG: glycerate kinase [Candidatus Hydrothermarchaeales archaeon]
MEIKNKTALIGNGQTMRDRRAREIALEVLERILREADPKIAVKNALRLVGNELDVRGVRFNLEETENIYVVGGGKAGGGMAEVLEEILDGRISKGLVNVPEGTKGRYRASRIELNEASHPIPNESGAEGVKRMLQIADEAGEDDLVIVLISGGGSALLPLPSEGLSLNDMQKVTEALLKSGAVIDEINAVRKHLSEIKGGKLAAACYPATIVPLIISDVVGDPIDVIASGPTAPDQSTYEDALRILEKYGLMEEFPKIKGHLEKGLQKKIPETLKSKDRVFNRVHNFLISTNEIILRKVLKDISGQHDTKLLTTNLEGEAKDVGEWLGAVAMKEKGLKKGAAGPRIILAGGETTVTVKGRGEGGRNQELVLGAMSGLKGEGLCIASIGTDGIDGVTDAAGAIIDGKSYEKAVQMELSPGEYLDNNDSNTFFKKLDDLIMTGATGTNINDIAVVVLV